MRLPALLITPMLCIVIAALLPSCARAGAPHERSPVVVIAATDDGGSATQKPVDGGREDSGWKRDGLTIGEVTVLGGKAEDATREVARSRPRFRHCYRRALDDDPSAAGSADFELELDAQGESLEVRMVRRGISSELAQCLEHAAEQIHTSPPQPGPVTLVFRITFDPRAADE